MRLNGYIISEVNRVWARQLGNRGSVPDESKRFLCFPTSRQALGPTQPRVCNVHWGVKLPGREANHSDQVPGLKMVKTYKFTLEQAVKAKTE